MSDAVVFYRGEVTKEQILFIISKIKKSEYSQKCIFRCSEGGEDHGLIEDIKSFKEKIEEINPNELLIFQITCYIINMEMDFDLFDKIEEIFKYKETFSPVRSTDYFYQWVILIRGLAIKRYPSIIFI